MLFLDFKYVNIASAGLCQRPCWGSLQRSPAGIKEEGRDGKGWHEIGRKGTGGKGKGVEGRVGKERRRKGRQGR